jgi:hypothetical protein
VAKEGDRWLSREMGDYGWLSRKMGGQVGSAPVATAALWFQIQTSLKNTK